MYQGHELENWTKNTIKYNSLSTASFVSVAFTFNISARCFTPASPIALSTHDTKTVRNVWTKKSDLHPNMQNKLGPSTAIHSPPRWSTVNVVFTFRAAEICTAPLSPILFPIYQESKRKLTWNEDETPFTHSKSQFDSMYCCILMLRQYTKHQHHQFHYLINENKLTTKNDFPKKPQQKHKNCLTVKKNWLQCCIHIQYVGNILCTIIAKLII